MNRPSWDEYFMEITEKIAERSTCLRRRVGAVIVKDVGVVPTYPEYLYFSLIHGKKNAEIFQ